MTESPNNFCPNCKKRFFLDMFHKPNIAHFCPNCGSDKIYISLARQVVNNFDLKLKRGDFDHLKEKQ